MEGSEILVVTRWGSEESPALRVAFYSGNQGSFMMTLVSLVIHAIMDGGTRTVHFSGSIPKDLWMRGHRER